MKINRLVKVCLIMAAAGLVLCATGFAFGGRVYGINLGRGGIVVNSNHSTGVNGSIQYIDEEKELPSFSNINIDMAFADLKVVESDHFGVKSHLNEECPITTEVEGDTLSITQKRGNVGSTTFTFFSVGFPSASGLNNEQEYVIIYVPEKTEFDQVMIENECGDVTTGDLQAKDVQISDQFGNFQAKTVTAETINIEMESGDAEMKNVAATMLTVKNQFGSIKIDNAMIADEFRGTIETGDVTLGTVETGSLNLKTSFGGVEGDRITADDVVLDLESGECTIDVLSGKKTKVDSTFGSVNLGLSNSVDDYAIDASSEMGGVCINDEDMGMKYRESSSDAVNSVEVHSQSGEINLFDAD